MDQPTHKAKTLDGQWVEGWYDGSDQDDPTIYKYGSDKSVVINIPINPSTLCRSTYRPDSNGKLMYEGDEVEVDGMKFTINYSIDTCSFVLIHCNHEDIKEEFSFYKTYTLTRKKHD